MDPSPLQQQGGSHPHQDQRLRVACGWVLSHQVSHCLSSASLHKTVPDCACDIMQMIWPSTTPQRARLPTQRWTLTPLSDWPTVPLPRRMSCFRTRVCNKPGGWTCDTAKAAAVALMHYAVNNSFAVRHTLPCTDVGVWRFSVAFQSWLLLDLRMMRRRVNQQVKYFQISSEAYAGPIASWAGHATAAEYAAGLADWVPALKSIAPGAMFAMDGPASHEAVGGSDTDATPWYKTVRAGHIRRCR